jgi:hypothetical protein
VLTYLLGLPGNEDVRSANPVVGETNDGFLNDIRARSITEADVLSAIRGAAEGRSPRVPSGRGGAPSLSATRAESAPRAARCRRRRADGRSACSSKPTSVAS